MPRTLTTVADPTWKGFGDNPVGLIKRYADFVVHHRIEIDKTGPVIAKQELDDAIEHEVSTKHEADHCKKRLARVKQQLVDAQARLVEVSDEDARQLAEQLLTLPFVIGSRLERNGLPAVQIRIAADYEGERYDIGDFDITFDDRRDNIFWVRTPEVDGDPMRCSSLHNFYAIKRDTNGTSGRLDGPGTVQLSRSVEFLQECYDTLGASAGKEWHGSQFPVLDEEGLANIAYEHISVDSFAKSIQKWDRSKSRVAIRQEIRDLEHSIRRYEVDAEWHVVSIREAKKRVRDCRADYQQAVKAAQGTTAPQLDLRQARRDIKYIATLPGVMGMRFAADGTPVVHVRSSHVYRGTRYDMGDYEIYFRLCTEAKTNGVINVHATRGGSPWYSHSYTFDVPSSWFCVNARAREVRNHFDKGEFASLIHLLINTMNGVNVERRYEVPVTFHQIPMDCVWKSQVTLPRMRPRRKPKSQRGAEIKKAMGQVALQAAAIL